MPAHLVVVYILMLWEFSAGLLCTEAIMGFKSPCNHVNKGDVTAPRQRPISQRLLLLHRNQKHIRTQLLSHPWDAVCTLIRALNSLPSMKPCSWRGSSIKSFHQPFALHSNWVCISSEKVFKKLWTKKTQNNKKQRRITAALVWNQKICLW